MRVGRGFFFWREKETRNRMNPFTPKSDQCQISPAASPEILHHTVWRTWLFTAYSDERWLHYQFSLPHPYISLQEGWENALFEPGSARVNSRMVQTGRQDPPMICVIYVIPTLIIFPDSTYQMRAAFSHVAFAAASSSRKRVSPMSSSREPSGASRPSARRAAARSLALSASFWFQRSLGWPKDVR